MREAKYTSCRGRSSDLEISCDRGEIKRAIGLLVNGKAAGQDGILAEAIKADMDTSTYIDMLYSLLGKIWLEEVVPADSGRLDT